MNKSKGNRESLQDVLTHSEQQRSANFGGSRPTTPAVAVEVGPMVNKIFGVQLVHRPPSSGTAKSVVSSLPIPPLVGLSLLEMARDERDLEYLKDYAVFPLLNEAGLRIMHTNADGPKHCDVVAAISGACEKVQFERSSCYADWVKLQRDLGASATPFIETVVDGYSKFHALSTVFVQGPDASVEDKKPSNNPQQANQRSPGKKSTDVVSPQKKKEHPPVQQSESLHLQFMSRVVNQLEVETSGFEQRFGDLLGRTPPLIEKALENPKPYLISTASRHSNASSRGPRECLGMSFDFSSRQIADTLTNRRRVVELCTRMSYLRNELSRIPWRLAMGQAHQLKHRVELDESKYATNWLEELREQNEDSANHKPRDGFELEPAVLHALLHLDEAGVARWIRRRQEELHLLTDGVNVRHATLVALQTMKDLPSLSRHGLGRLGMYAMWTEILVLYQRYLPLLAHLLHCNAHWQVLLNLPDEKFEHRLQLAITNCKVDDRSLYDVTLLLHDRQDCVTAIEHCMDCRRRELRAELETFQRESGSAKAGKGDGEGEGKKKRSKPL